MGRRRSRRRTRSRRRRSRRRRSDECRLLRGNAMVAQTLLQRLPGPSVAAPTMLRCETEKPCRLILDLLSLWQRPCPAFLGCGPAHRGMHPARTHCSMRCRAVPCYAMPIIWCVVRCYTTLYGALRRDMRCCAVLCDAVLRQAGCYARRCFAKPCHATLWYNKLCHVMLSYAMRLLLGTHGPQAQ